MGGLQYGASHYQSLILDGAQWSKANNATISAIGSRAAAVVLRNHCNVWLLQAVDIPTISRGPPSQSNTPLLPPQRPTAEGSPVAAVRNTFARVTLVSIRVENVALVSSKRNDPTFYHSRGHRCQTSLGAKQLLPQHNHPSSPGKWRHKGSSSRHSKAHLRIVRRNCGRVEASSPS